MMLDKQLCFSVAQDLAQIVASYSSTNVIDLGAADTPALARISDGTAYSLIRDIARGGDIELLIQVTETFTSGGAATLTVTLQQDDAAAFGSPTTVMATSALALATLVAGYTVKFSLSPNQVTERFLRLSYAIGTATTTAGKVTAGFVIDRQTNTPTI